MGLYLFRHNSRPIQRVIFISFTPVRPPQLYCRFACLIPALLHQPPEADDVDPNRFNKVEIVRKRLQKDEIGSWTQLYQDLLKWSE